MAKGLKLIRRMDAAGLIRWYKPKPQPAPHSFSRRRSLLRLRMAWYQLKNWVRPPAPGPAYITCECLMGAAPASFRRLVEVHGQ